jgi:HPt (histidine-containing phosphotransfer) domain-containing protein
MREVIEEQNRNLEQKVLERTAELRQKTNDIANMMANMHQGLFTITTGGLIHKEYAQYLEQIFETDRIADRNFSDLLFAHTTAGSDAVDQCITAVDAIVGEDEMMWDFNSHCLIKEMAITLDGNTKILELDWDPIIGEGGEVDKVMVTVRDVTQLKALEAAAEEQKRELEIIGEILAVDAGKFGEFIRSSEAFMAECREIIGANRAKDLDVIARLFRNMHTVKGNARTYGLSHVTNVVHEVESTYDRLRKDDECDWNQALLLQELTGAEEIIASYAHVFRDKLGRESEVASGVTLDPVRVASWLDSIQQITSAELPNQVKSVVSEAYRMLISIDAKPVSLVISDVVDSVKSLASQLEKAEPHVAIKDGNIFIEKDAHSMLNNIFMHVFRNAMDHGIEKPDERVAKGKQPAGLISLEVEVSDGHADMCVRDDGRGIAVGRIYRMAIEKGIYSADDPKPSARDIANLIFASGFSTAEAVTDVSGRGVGMDAVKGFLEKEGGSIEVILDPGGEEDDFRTFSTRIRLPEKFYRVVLDFEHSA